MPEFKVHNLWPIPIYQNHMPIDDQLMQLINSLEFERMKSGNGNITVDRNILLRKDFADLKDKIQEHCKLYVKNLLSISDRTNFYIQNSWINIHKPQDCAQSHIHTNSLISGCLYLKIPENSGQIRFYKNQGYVNLFPTATTFDYNEVNHITADFWNLEPKEGMIILFPAHLLHEVDKNNSTEDRYSLAFNLYARGTFGYDECYLELK